MPDQPPGRPARRSALTAVAAIAGGAAVVMATLGIRDVVSGAEPLGADVEPAVAAAAPATVAPLAPLAPQDPTTARLLPDAPPTTAAAPNTAAPVDAAIDEPAAGDPPITARPPRPSPAPPTAAGTGAPRRTAADGEQEPKEPVALADLLGPRRSAIPESPPPKSPPVSIAVSSLDLAGVPIRPVALSSDGQLEIPDQTTIGWYRYGATAGEAGTTVLAAHVSWNGVPGPFAELKAVDPGDRVEIQRDDGQQRTYEVVERALYGKLELPRERLWRRSGPETLVLMTCGGDTTPENDHFLENVVVYAVPVG